MSAPNTRPRRSGTGTVRRVSGSTYEPYEARTSRSKEQPRGDLIGRFASRYQAERALDAWVAARGKEVA